MRDLLGHFDPTIQTGGALLLAERLEYLNLTAEPDNITDTRADACMNTHIGKACTELNPKYGASGYADHLNRWALAPRRSARTV